MAVSGSRAPATVQANQSSSVPRPFKSARRRILIPEVCAPSGEFGGDTDFGRFL
jgi:hypothetical protein